nr:MAG TPA: hypothetical protein [Caudoviricetes sp.]
MGDKVLHCKNRWGGYDKTFFTDKFFPVAIVVYDKNTRTTKFVEKVLYKNQAVWPYPARNEETPWFMKMLNPWFTSWQNDHKRYIYNPATGFGVTHHLGNIIIDKINNATDSRKFPRSVDLDKYKIIRTLPMSLPGVFKQRKLMIGNVYWENDASTNEQLYIEYKIDRSLMNEIQNKEVTLSFGIKYDDNTTLDSRNEGLNNYDNVYLNQIHKPGNVYHLLYFKDQSNPANKHIIPNHYKPQGSIEMSLDRRSGDRYYSKYSNNFYYTRYSNGLYDCCDPSLKFVTRIPSEFILNHFNNSAGNRNVFIDIWLGVSNTPGVVYARASLAISNFKWTRRYL